MIIDFSQIFKCKSSNFIAGNTVGIHSKIKLVGFGKIKIFVKIDDICCLMEFGHKIFLLHVLEQNDVLVTFSLYTGCFTDDAVLDYSYSY